ncbi:TPA: hypothetical protein RMI67_006660 [Bacillus cereus]|nr:hypothetical protein [Bacillus cereus]
MTDRYKNITEVYLLFIGNGTSLVIQGLDAKWFTSTGDSAEIHWKNKYVLDE